MKKWIRFFDRLIVLTIFAAGLSGCNIARRSRGNTPISNLATSSLCEKTTLKEAASYKNSHQKQHLKTSHVSSIEGMEEDNPVCNRFCILQASEYAVELCKPNSLKKKTNATTKTTEYNEEVEKFICREKKEGDGLSLLLFRVHNSRSFERAPIGRKNTCSFGDKWLRKKNAIKQISRIQIRRQKTSRGRFEKGTSTWSHIF